MPNPSFDDDAAANPTEANPDAVNPDVAVRGTKGGSGDPRVTDALDVTMDSGPTKDLMATTLDGATPGDATPGSVSSGSATSGSVSSGAGAANATMVIGPGEKTSESDYPPDLRNFGDFELENEIARGGMGVVYRARQKSLGRNVAIKMILSGRLAGEHELSRFRAEASAAAGLDHPNIVPIYQVGEHRGQHFFAMGLVEGRGLDDWIRRGAMPPMVAAGILRQISSAIAYAHGQNVVHRDLKPGNVLITETDGSGSQSLSARITDFGLAKRVDRPDELTGSGNIVGTPSYMAPEQAAGDTASVGPPADIYALGSLGYALVTGEPPFRGASTIDTIRQVISKDPVPPRQINGEVPRDLETILLKCLQKDPRRRYETAMAVADDLERFLAGEEILARPITRLERAGRWVSRHRWFAASAVTTAVVLIAASIIGPLLAVSAENARVTAEAATERAERSRVKAETASREAVASSRDAESARHRAEAALDELHVQQSKNRADLYAGEIPLAATLWDDGRPDAMRNLLYATPAEHRGWEWRHLMHRPDQDVTHLRYHGFPIVGGRFVGDDVITADGLGFWVDWRLSRAGGSRAGGFRTGGRNGVARADRGTINRGTINQGNVARGNTAKGDVAGGNAVVTRVRRDSPSAVTLSDGGSALLLGDDDVRWRDARSGRGIATFQYPDATLLHAAVVDAIDAAWVLLDANEPTDDPNAQAVGFFQLHRRDGGDADAATVRRGPYVALPFDPNTFVDAAMVVRSDGGAALFVLTGRSLTRFDIELDLQTETGDSINPLVGDSIDPMVSDSIDPMVGPKISTAKSVWSIELPGDASTVAMRSLRVGETAETTLNAEPKSNAELDLSVDHQVWVGGRDGTVWTVDADRGQVLQTAKFGLSPIRQFAFQPVTERDAETGRSPNVVTRSPVVAVGGDDRWVHLVNGQTMQLIDRVVPGDPLVGLDFDDAGNRLLILRKHTATVYHGPGLDGRDDDATAIVDIAPSDIGGAVWVLNRRGRITLYDVAGQRNVRTLRAADAEARAMHLATLPRRHRLAVVMADRQNPDRLWIENWDTLSSTLRDRTAMPADGCADLSTDGSDEHFVAIAQLTNDVKATDRDDPADVERAAGTRRPHDRSTGKGSSSKGSSSKGSSSRGSSSRGSSSRGSSTMGRLSQTMSIGGEVWVYSADGGDVVRRFGRRDAAYNGLTPTGQPNRVAATTRDGRLTFFDTREGAVVDTRRTSLALSLTDVVLSPDQTRIAAVTAPVGDDGGVIFVWQINGDDFWTLNTAQVAPVRRIVFAGPDRIAAACSDGLVRVYRIDPGAEVLRLPLSGGDVDTIHFDDQTGDLVVGDGDGSPRRFARGPLSESSVIAADDVRVVADWVADQFDPALTAGLNNPDPGSTEGRTGTWTRTADALSASDPPIIETSGQSLAMAFLDSGPMRLPDEFVLRMAPRLPPQGILYLQMGHRYGPPTMIQFMAQPEPFLHSEGYEVQQMPFASFNDAVPVVRNARFNVTELGSGNDPPIVELHFHRNAVDLVYDGKMVARGNLPTRERNRIQFGSLDPAGSDAVAFERLQLLASDEQLRRLELVAKIDAWLGEYFEPRYVAERIDDQSDWTSGESEYARQYLAMRTSDSQQALLAAVADLAKSTPDQRADAAIRTLAIADACLAASPGSMNAQILSAFAGAVSGRAPDLFRDVQQRHQRIYGYASPLLVEAAGKFDDKTEPSGRGVGAVRRAVMISALTETGDAFDAAAEELLSGEPISATAPERAMAEVVKRYLGGTGDADWIDAVARDVRVSVGIAAPMTGAKVPPMRLSDAAAVQHLRWACRGGQSDDVLVAFDNVSQTPSQRGVVIDAVAVTMRREPGQTPLRIRHRIRTEFEPRSGSAATTVPNETASSSPLDAWRLVSMTIAPVDVKPDPNGPWCSLTSGDASLWRIASTLGGPRQTVARRILDLVRWGAVGDALNLAARARRDDPKVLSGATGSVVMAELAFQTGRTETAVERLAALENIPRLNGPFARSFAARADQTRAAAGGGRRYLAHGLSAVVPPAWRSIDAPSGAVSMPGDAIGSFRFDNHLVFVRRLWTGESQSAETLATQLIVNMQTTGIDVEGPKIGEIAGNRHLMVEMKGNPMRRQMGPSADENATLRIDILPRDSDVVIIWSLHPTGVSPASIDSQKQFLESLDLNAEES